MAIRVPEYEKKGWSRGSLILFGFGMGFAAPLIVGLIPGLIENGNLFTDPNLGAFVIFFGFFVGIMGAIAGYFATRD